MTTTTPTTLRDALLLVEQQRMQIERQRAALEQIEHWANAYPITAFPEPDLDKARALLIAGWISINAISASAMRHVLDGVREIVRDALREQ